MIKWINGKKTVIGFLLSVIVGAFVLVTGQAVNGFAGFDNWEGLITAAIAGLAGIFGTSGVVHKAAKGELTNKGRVASRASSNPPPPDRPRENVKRESAE
jgi:hypothetical protein